MVKKWAGGAGIQRCYSGFGDKPPVSAAPKELDPIRLQPEKKEGGGEKGGGRKAWINLGLGDGVNLEAFAVFYACVCHCRAFYTGLHSTPLTIAPSLTDPFTRVLNFLYPPPSLHPSIPV